MITNYGILRVDGTSYTKPVAVVGIRLSDYEGVNDFHNSLYYDKYYPGTTTLGPQRIPVIGYDDITSVTAYPSRALQKRRAVLLIGIGDRFPISIRRKDLVGSPPLRPIWDELLGRVAAATADGSRLDHLINQRFYLFEIPQDHWPTGPAA